MIDDAELDAAAVLARGDQRRAFGRAEPQCVADDVDQDPFQQARVGRDRRQVVGDAQADLTRPRAELVERPGYGVLDPDRPRG